MRTNLLMFFLLAFVSAFSFGQSQITLKNGDKIEGELKSLVNGVFTVKFKGNNITLKQSDIESIIMDKKASSNTSVNAKAEVKGVVTYYFNKNYGDKPDVGAIVYLRKTDTTNQKRSIFFTYKMVKVCKNSKSEFCIKQLKQLNADTKEGFDKIDSEAAEEKIKLDRENNGVLKSTVDGNGNFSIGAEPGLYEIIYVSKGRTAMTVTEIQGKIDTKIISLKAGETIVSDFRFDIY